MSVNFVWRTCRCGRADRPARPEHEHWRPEYIAEFFAKRLRRHDFGRYIAERLAADFACALAQYLSEHDAASRAEPCVELPRFPTMLRKMWSGGEVQRWIDENIAPHVLLTPATISTAALATNSRSHDDR
ncbi:hypothetical protein WK94_26620 [Burkholderia ubonensis]|nr:hypothetical protein WK08_23510 [Burkholderia ubonensis]KVT85062.1 hypothetical protein WK58_28625 [Burkholderia ubonensis]KVW37638.1 hypothetical protein WK94_26620 [Burkholderia ubonensis]